jgi:hypothetical protein
MRGSWLPCHYHMAIYLGSWWNVFGSKYLACEPEKVPKQSRQLVECVCRNGQNCQIASGI